MTVEEYFKSLANKQEIKQEEQDFISQKHNFLREKLREKLTIEDDFLTGSYGRNTMKRPTGDEKFDVDFFLVFNKKNYGEKELPDLLKEVKDALDEIKGLDEDILEVDDKQKRSIGVIYKNNFRIDVVPAIEIEKDKHYKIFDKKTQQAVESNPKLHGENLTSANEATASGSVKRLVPIIKILKCWKALKCDYVKSFHLELLVTEILKSEEIKSFSFGLGKFFNDAGDWLLEAGFPDPANEENVIDEYLDDDETRNDLLVLIAEEKKLASNTLRLEKSGDFNGAIEIWKKLFEPAEDESFRKGGFDGYTTKELSIHVKATKPWLSSI